MNRRTCLAGLLAGAAMPGALIAAEGRFEVTRSRSEWRARLSQAEFQVMRLEGTERAGTSPLNKNFRAGTYHCKGCDLAVYPSETKFESGTGWPSFWRALPNAIRTKADRKLFSVRTECHCRRCGSHFGHIFDDGPAPTGLRHCLNGIALNFRAA